MCDVWSSQVDIFCTSHLCLSLHLNFTTNCSTKKYGLLEQLLEGFMTKIHIKCVISLYVLGRATEVCCMFLNGFNKLYFKNCDI